MEKISQEMENYSYAKYIDELLKLAKKRRLGYEIIGYEKFERIGALFPLYRFIINPKGKFNFCLVAGVQAYEIAGPLAILYSFRNPDKFYHPDVCYRIYPLLNPTSFDLRQRNDDDNRDLNTVNKRTLRSKNYQEIISFYQDIKKKNFDVFLSLHEDMDEKRFYAYVFEKEEEPVYRRIIKNAAKDLEILKDKKIYGDLSDGNGLLINKHDQSIEDYLFKKGRARISFCAETPGQLDLAQRIKTDLKIIKILSRHIIKDKTNGN